MAVDPNTEQIVLVDRAGNPIGSGPKLDLHNENTPLHLAFSVYIFNDKGELLVTRRALHKKVWPSVWTNSCCGHPQPNETMQDAINRRVRYELGMQIGDLQIINDSYIYKTPPYNGVIEHEFCPIFVGRATQEPDPNPEEVADYTWMSWDDYSKELSNDTKNQWSWWAKDQFVYFTKGVIPASTHRL